MEITERIRDFRDQIQLIIRDIQLLGREYFELKFRYFIKFINISTIVYSLWRIIRIILLALSLFFLIGLLYYIPWAGFGQTINQQGQTQQAKTIWDWLELLIIPLVLSLVALSFQASGKKSEKEEIKERNREKSLSTFYDYIQKILFTVDMEDEYTEKTASVISSARAQVLIKSLDSERKATLVKFLYEANLIKTSKPIISLFKADLSGIVLDHSTFFDINLHNVDCRRASFEFSNLTGSNISGSWLSSSNFYSAILTRSYLEYCTIEEADFSNAQMEEISLGKSIARKSNFSKANLVKARLIGVDFYRANFREANLLGSLLNNSDLISANLSNADLSNADLTGANLMYANLKGANLSGAILRRTIISEKQLKNAKTYEGAIIEDIQPRLGPPMSIEQILEERERIKREFEEYNHAESKTQSNEEIK